MEEKNLKMPASCGLIPGPLETREAFEKRASYCLSLKETLFKELMPKDALFLENLVEDGILSEVFTVTDEVCGFSHTFLPIYFSNEGLSFWHGAALWIFQKDETSPLGAFIQLRKVFYKQKRFLFIYSRPELIAHEMVHAMRMAFQEPKYEEVLAYRTSKNFISRYLGPIVSTSLESRLFVILLVMIIMLDLAALYFGSIELYMSALWLKTIPLFLIVVYVLKLIQKQRRVSSVFEKLKELYLERGKVILFGLTDKEIDEFSRWSHEDIADYIEREPSFRFEFLRGSL